MVTVFTPLYNRAYIVERLYISLKNQTVKDFEWLVIDDGSTDNAKEKFDMWKNQDNGFEIRYIRCENGGKHRAINKGVPLAKGELFFIVDSDDCLPEDSIKNIIKIENGIENKSKFAGIAGIKRTFDNNLVGTTFKEKYVDATSLERDKFGIAGDKSEVFYTDILKKYPFPEFEGEKFVTEDVVWSRIAADGYKIRWTNEDIYICEYLDDGLTSKGREIYINSPLGYALYVKQIAKFKKMNTREKINYYYYFYYDLKDKFSISEISKLLDTSVLLLGIKITEMRLRQCLHNVLKR
ncbi:MAG: glycosyltransferase family A protein [Acutalibacteraceae bacterium]|nr:glycosyltransferase family A protein [Acutalibacteraceae bacterium]